MTYRRWLGLLALLLVGLELGLTFWQSYQLPLDGDLTAVVAPAPWYAQVLGDPFGWAALRQGATYSGPNRFFVHASMYGYWRLLPRLWQDVGGLTPISSLYASAALFSAACQALLLGLLAAYARVAAGGRGWGGWLLGLGLLAPLFQLGGFNEQMGIINRAVTYTFSYTYPMGLLGLALWPLYRAACQGQPLRLAWWRAGLLGALLVVVAFSGPAAAGTSVVVLLAVAGWWLAAARREAAPGGPALRLTRGWLSGPALGLLAWLAALTVYSFYLARFNVEGKTDYTLAQLFALLPRGLWQQLTQQAGLPLLLALLGLNAWLLRRRPLADDPQAGRVRRLLGWVAGLSALYVLLLPFGGYRSYRPYLLRNDSIQPVLLGLFLAYGASALYLLGALRGRPRQAYAALVGAFSLLFVGHDLRPTLAPTNDCERWGLDQLARSPPTEAVVPLSPQCPVLSWELVTSPYYAQPTAEMLYRWRVTPTVKPFVQRP